MQAYDGAMVRLHVALGLTALGLTVLAAAAPGRAFAQPDLVVWRAVIDVEGIDAESVGGIDARAALARGLEPGVRRCAEAALEGDAAPRSLRGRLTLRAHIRAGRVQRSSWTGDPRAPAGFVRCLARLAGTRVGTPLNVEVEVPFRVERREMIIIGALGSSAPPSGAPRPPVLAPPPTPRLALTHESVGAEDESAEEQLAAMLRSRVFTLTRAYGRMSPPPVGRCTIHFGVRAATGTLSDRRVVCEEEVASVQPHLERWIDGLRLRPGTVTDGVAFEVVVELQGLSAAD